MTVSIIGLFVATLCLHRVQSQFPRVCVNFESLKSKTCCPTPNGFNAPCGSDGDRGECRDFIVRRWDRTYSHYQEFHKKDERHNWPNALFNRTCVCKANFAGYDCSECKYGYYGDDCNQKRILKRRDFAKLPTEEQDRYMSYINKTRYVNSDFVVSTSPYQKIQEQINKGLDPVALFHNISTYDIFTFMHYYAANGTGIEFAHEGQGFPTWHRGYLLAWERTIQKVNQDDEFAIPYWDWTKNKDKCEICTKDLLGVTGQDGIVTGKYFNDWYTICTPEQTLGMNKLCHPADKKPGLERLKDSDKEKNEEMGYHMNYPIKKEVDFALGFETFDLPPYTKESSCNFRNILEGFVNTSTGYRLPNSHCLHNQVHLAIGGAMNSTLSASNDPIFLLHHSFVDRILEKWLRKYNKNASVLSSYDAPIGHNRGDAIVPLFPVCTHEDFFKVSFELGYDFEDVDEEGYSPDDGVSPAALGLCPVISDTANTSKNCERYKTTTFIFIAISVALLIILLGVVGIVCCRFRKMSKENAETQPLVTAKSVSPEIT